MEDILTPVLVCAVLFIGAPWVVLHYVTKWKHASKITPEDENMLDEMFNLARRLEERVHTVERIVAADHPDWKPGIDSPQPDWKPESSLAEPRFDRRPDYHIDRRN